MEKAQKGDLIRITNPVGVGNAYERTYNTGHILEVTARGRDNDRGVYTKELGQKLIFDSEYRIHRKAGEEDAATVPAKATLHSREKVLPRHEAEAMQDAVNSPNHYTQGKFETIEVIEEITQGYSDGYVAYCVGNALKYLARAPFKHDEPTEDIGKAAKYIEFALVRLQTQK